MPSHTHTHAHPSLMRRWWKSVRTSMLSNSNRKKKGKIKENNNIIKVKETKLKFWLLCSCDKCMFEWRQRQLWFSKLKSMYQRFDYKRYKAHLQHMNIEHNKAHVESLMYLLKFIFHWPMIFTSTWQSRFEKIHIFRTLFTIIGKLTLTLLVGNNGISISFSTHQS